MRLFNEQEAIRPAQAKERLLFLKHLIAEKKAAIQLLRDEVGDLESQRKSLYSIVKASRPAAAEPK